MKKNTVNSKKLIRVLFNDNRWLLILSVLTLVIGYTFIMMVTSLSKAIIMTKQKTTIDQYGDFLAIVSDVSYDDAKSIKDQMPEYSYDQFQVLGTINHHGADITIGQMEQSMGKHLGFRLLYGDWPSTSAQIVIEEYLASRLGIDSSMLPYSMTCKENEGQTEYQVTGVINNYSYLLVTDADSSLHTAIYPSCICGGRQDEAKGISLLVRQSKISFKLSQQDVFQFADQYIALGIPYKALSLNNNLYFYGYNDIQDVSQITIIYSLLLHVILIITEVILLWVLFIKNKENLYLFRALGLSEIHKKRMLLLLIAIIIGSSMILGFLIASIFGAVFIEHTFREYSSAYYQELFVVVMKELITAAVLLLCGFIMILKGKDRSIIEGMRKVNRVRRCQFKRVDGKIIVMYTALIFFIIASMNFIAMFHMKDRNVEYNLISKKSNSFEVVNGFYIEHSKSSYFPFTTLDELSQYNDYIQLSMEADTQLGSLLLKKDNIDQYFTEFLRKNEVKDAIGGGSNIKELMPKEVDEYVSVPHELVNIVVLPEMQFGAFKKSHNIVSDGKEHMKEKNCIVIIPDYDISNPTLKQNESITIGGVRTEDGNVRLYSDQVQIQDIISSQQSDSTYLTLVFSEESAKKCSTISGYHSIKVVVQKDAPQEVLGGINNSINSIIASTQGGMLGSTIQDDQSNQILKNYTALFSNTMNIFSFLSIILYILLGSYIDWNNNKHEYGVFRCFGMSFHNLQRKLWRKYLTSIAISSIIAVWLGSTAFPNGAMKKEQILLSILVVIIITFGCKEVIYHKFSRQSISHMMSDE